MTTQLLLALRVLRRRKFFTFISLFGISFTIMALVVISAMGDAAAGDNAPLGNRDRLVIASHFRSERVVPDTSYTIDSSLVDGLMTYDSTMQIGEDVQSDNNSSLGIHAYEKYLTDVAGVENHTLMAPSATFDLYIDGRKVTYNGNFTDANFWEIFDYDFLHGSPFNKDDVESGIKKVVLTDEAAKEYFGKADATLIGKSIQLADIILEISGIVKTPRAAITGLNADAFIPYTLAPDNFFEKSYHGMCVVVFLAPSKNTRNIIIDDLDRIASSIEPLPTEDRNRFHIEGLTFGEEFADRYVGTGIERHKSFARFLGPISVLILMFFLLPALNLMNINVSRVYERNAEIAVRKSFGATDGDILRQFLVETLIITLIGGILGVLLALILISLINTNDWLAGYKLAFTGEVAAWSLAIILLFTLVTGLLPALRMARTKIATSLR